MNHENKFRRIDKNVFSESSLNFMTRGDRRLVKAFKPTICLRIKVSTLSATLLEIPPNRIFFNPHLRYECYLIVHVSIHFDNFREVLGDFALALNVYSNFLESNRKLEL